MTILRRIDYMRVASFATCGAVAIAAATTAVSFTLSFFA